jgi:hypothetical protein
MGEGRNVYRVLVGKPEGKRPLERPRRRWEYGIKMGLGEIGWGGVEWIHLAQDMDNWRAVVNAVVNLWVLAPRSLLQPVTRNIKLTCYRLCFAFLYIIFFFICLFFVHIEIVRWDFA